MSKGDRKVSAQNHGSRKGQIADVIPSLRKDLQNAKLLLQQRSDGSGDSLYDHLSRVISKVIDERPKNVIDHFELFSERVRVENFQMQEVKLANAYKEPERLEKARQRLPVLVSQSQHTIARVNENEKSDGSEPSSKSIANGEDELDDEEEEQNDFIYHEAAMAKDLCELQFYWNLFGIGFPREEVFSLSCALRQLKRKNASIDSCRFWGKIFGLQNDYYVVECTLTVESIEERIVSNIFLRD
jgi:radial spoke head protein 4A